MCVLKKSVRTLRSRLLYTTTLLLSFYFPAADAQTVDLQISRLINSGQIESAERILEASNPDDIARLFFAGRVYKVLRKFPAAIAIFREILKRDPNHINAKRELAHTLLLAGEYEDADTYFQELLSTDNNEAMQEGYRRFINVIERNKPSGIGLQISLLPSSNINKGTNNTVFDSEFGDFVIDPSMQVESGIGVQFEFFGFFRQPVSSQSNVQLDWALSGAKYRNETYDSATSLLSISYEKRTSNGHWSLEGYGRYMWRKGGEDISILGGKYEFGQMLSPINSFALSLMHEYRSYPLSGYQDGPFTSGVISITHQIGTSFSISGGIRSEQSHPIAEHLQYISNTAYGRISKTWSEETQTTVGIHAGRRDFIGVYPLTSSSRVDTYSGVNFSVYNTRINFRGFTPKLSCAFTSNSSNVSIFDYDVTDCHIGASIEF